MSCPSGKSKKVCRDQGSEGVPEIEAKNPRQTTFIKAAAGLLGVTPKLIEGVFMGGCLGYRRDRPDADEFRMMLMKAVTLLDHLKATGTPHPVRIDDSQPDAPLPTRAGIAGYAAIFDFLASRDYDFVTGDGPDGNEENFGGGVMRCHECGLLVNANHLCLSFSLTDGVWWETSDTEPRRYDHPTTNKKSHQLSQFEFSSYGSLVFSPSANRHFWRASNGFEYPLPVEKEDDLISVRMDELTDRIHRELIEKQLAFDPNTVPLIHLGRDYPDLANQYGLLAHLDAIRFAEETVQIPQNTQPTAAPKDVVDKPMDRERAIKCMNAGWPVIVDTGMSGKYTGRLVDVRFEPGKPWRGTVRITGVLEIAAYDYLRENQRRGFRPGQEVESTGKHIRPTDQADGGPYLDGLRARIAQVEERLSDGDRAYVIELRNELYHLKEVLASEETNPPPEDWSEEGYNEWVKNLKGRMRTREMWGRQYIDVVYPVKPTDEVCDLLRAHGFFYSYDVKAWTATQSPVREELARYLAGELPAPPAAPDVFVQGWRIVKTEAGEEMIAVRFPNAPSLEVRDRLKAAGFRWRNDAWQAPPTPELEKLAKSLFEADDPPASLGDEEPPF